MMNTTDSNADVAIREALRNADGKGKLGVVAAVTGIAGGEQRLREIMESTAEIGLLERGMLLSHLERNDVPSSYDISGEQLELGTPDPCDRNDAYGSK